MLSFPFDVTQCVGIAALNSSLALLQQSRRLPKKLLITNFELFFVLKVSICEHGQFFKTLKTWLKASSIISTENALLGYFPKSAFEWRQIL